MARDEFAVPLLFLNATVVETGQRAVVHPLGAYPAGQTGPFADALDVSALMGTEMPVSTAAHLSARFTYVSPAGLVDTHRTDAPRWIRLVDGGYFDNSGTATLQEIARAIQRAHGTMAGARPMRVIVLHIPNDPPNDREMTAGGSGRAALTETLSPIRALLATRGAHATQAIEFMRGTAGSEQITLSLIARKRRCRWAGSSPISCVRRSANRSPNASAAWPKRAAPRGR